ncbi:MAG: hypothetical protein H7231_00385 [Rhodoferax sp.]|nr:hypothetical protein [Actinomycetota bacterium]
MISIEADLVRHVVEAATLAPSVHNTQPWRFVTRAAGFDLYADPARQLAVLDPAGRQLHLSCGAALAHARVAARAMGADAAVELLPTDDPTLLARVELSIGQPADDSEVVLAQALLTRHTGRGVYDDEPVEPALLDALQAVVDQEGAMLRYVRGAEMVELEVLLSEADAREQRDPDYRRELASWVRDTGDDGVPSDALADLSGRGSSLRLRDFSLSSPEQGSGQAPVAEHPDVAVLTTVGDSPQAWLHAGQAGGLLLLHAAVHGVQGQPLGQVTDTEGPRRRLSAVLGLVGVPQLVLRLGYARGHAATSRRALGDVLT